MTTVHDERPPARTTRRLSVLPAVVGLVGVTWVLVGAWVAGLTATDRGWTWAVVAAMAVLATVLTGSVAGLYSGLGLLIAVALFVADVETVLELLGLCLFLVMTHETVRFSLDARRPARFDRRLLVATFLRTAALAAVVTATVLVLHPLAATDPQGPAWLPLGLAGAGLPLLARSGGEQLDRLAPSLGPPVRALVGAAAAVAILVLVIVGAQARTAIDSGPEPGAGSDLDHDRPDPPTSTRRWGQRGGDRHRPAVGRPRSPGGHHPVGRRALSRPPATGGGVRSRRSGDRGRGSITGPEHTGASRHPSGGGGRR